LTATLNNARNKLQDKTRYNESLEIKYESDTNQLKIEFEKINKELELKKINIETLTKVGKQLYDSVSELKQSCRHLESEIQGLKKKHEYTVQDTTNVIKRFESDNFILKTLTTDFETQEHVLSN